MTGIDTLMIRGIKLENLDFMDDKLRVNNFVYNELELRKERKKFQPKRHV